MWKRKQKPVPEPEPAYEIIGYRLEKLEDGRKNGTDMAGTRQNVERLRTRGSHCGPRHLALRTDSALKAKKKAASGNTRP